MKESPGPPDIHNHQANQPKNWVLGDSKFPGFKHGWGGGGVYNFDSMFESRNTAVAARAMFESRNTAVAQPTIVARRTPAQRGGT
jgi:hypothetical protein